MGRENRRYPDDVAGRNSRVSQSQFETREAFTVFSYSFGEEDLLRDKRHELGCGASTRFELEIFARFEN
jgi:hypothetical protein